MNRFQLLSYQLKPQGSVQLHIAEPTADHVFEVETSSGAPMSKLRKLVGRLARVCVDISDEERELIRRFVTQDADVRSRCELADALKELRKA